MKTIFPKQECHVPKWYVIDATDKTLGRLATEVSKLLRGKETSYFTPGVNQGNYVVVLNANKIRVSGNKETEKLYYRTSGRPGGMKIETFKQLKERIPSRIIEKAVWGMLPKGVLGRDYYRKLYIYSDNKINYLKGKNVDVATSDNWIKVEI
jgi:large subunit ribosomal protein L13|tara:strand:+ start:4949 stop:5404 length:456 start_codon:yes stop_codon:yes gene_type:complete